MAAALEDVVVMSIGTIGNIDGDGGGGGCSSFDFCRVGGDGSGCRGSSSVGGGGWFVVVGDGCDGGFYGGCGVCGGVDGVGGFVGAGCSIGGGG